MANELEDATEIIPIMTNNDDSDLHDLNLLDGLPILPLKNTVLFPGVILPISVSREKSLRLLREVFEGNKMMGTLSQRDPEKLEPKAEDLFSIGTVAQILKLLEMPDGSTTVIIQGRKRFEVHSFLQEEPYFKVSAQFIDDLIPETNKTFVALIDSIKDTALNIIRLSANLPQEASFAIKNIDSPVFLVNFISSNSDLTVKEKQALLEINELEKRGTALLEHLSKITQMQELKNDIQVKVKKEIDQQQREYWLHQQMKTIQNELGGNPVDQEVTELNKKAADKKWEKQVADFFKKEVSKFQRMNAASGEYSVQLNFLQTLLELPWNEFTEDNFNIVRAQKVLDRDHFGMEKVKERIVEYLAVLKLKKTLKSPIICLVGPPGVGKTSLGRSVAEALGRKYVRMSLGGVHDEAEIRGHRRTYIGAMPGRIMQNIKKSKSANPVFILDEIDKLGQSVHGDPASALLEVLDPEQNNAFTDNYLELEFDLSKVLFIATANTTATIPAPLLDRMELINISGYILEEKVEIAIKHLVPKQIDAHGLKESKFSIPAKTLEYIVEHYTKESGVRELDKTLAKICRNLARKVAAEEKVTKKLLPEHIKVILGQPRYLKEYYQGNDYFGVVTGLAWTAHGGEILYIESSLSKGKGSLAITGNLGDVMKESATIALSYLKAHSGNLSISMDDFSTYDIHIHVPEGAIPKDGPSAGITMAVSLASAFTQRKVKDKLAMTGEITLRGKVLPVGGIKEKILAAKRAGIQEIILCVENRKDIEEINQTYLDGLQFHFVKDISEVLKIALI